LCSDLPLPLPACPYLPVTACPLPFCRLPQHGLLHYRYGFVTCDHLQFRSCRCQLPFLPHAAVTFHRLPAVTFTVTLPHVLPTVHVRSHTTRYRTCLPRLITTATCVTRFAVCHGSFLPFSVRYLHHVAVYLPFCRDSGCVSFLAFYLRSAAAAHLRLRATVTHCGYRVLRTVLLLDSAVYATTCLVDWFLPITVTCRATPAPCVYRLDCARFDYRLTAAVLRSLVAVFCACLPLVCVTFVPFAFTAVIFHPSSAGLPTRSAFCSTCDSRTVYPFCLPPDSALPLPHCLFYRLPDLPHAPLRLPALPAVSIRTVRSPLPFAFYWFT